MFLSVVTGEAMLPQFHPHRKIGTILFWWFNVLISDAPFFLLFSVPMLLLKTENWRTWILRVLETRKHIKRFTIEI